MNAVPVTIRPFVPRTASQQEYEQLNALHDIIRKEQLPDDPPLALEERIQGWQNIPDFVEVSAHTVWDDARGQIIAYSDASIAHTGDNEHICEFLIQVHPDYRCHGIARQLLGPITDFARQKDRNLFISYTYASSPAGEWFLSRIGARRGLEAHTNQLKIADLPAGWVEHWVRTSQALAGQFALGLWEGPLPEEHLASVVAMLQVVINDQPRDQLDIEDMNITPEVLREVEKNLFAQGQTRWTMYLQDRASGQFAGLTEVFWRRNSPGIVHQGFTAVLPKYRSRGLGRWLKAAMMQKLLRDHPQTEIVRTGNANSNAPMLKINQEMGFQPYIAHTTWQVERAAVEGYLGRTPAR